MSIKTIEEYFKTIEENKVVIFQEVFNWILTKYPSLELKIAWNQPMFVDHGTFIIGFSASKQHFSISPELFTMQAFEEDIKKSGYDYSKMLFKIKWTEAIQYDLLAKIIEFNIKDKKDMIKFWRE